MNVTQIRTARMSWTSTTMVSQAQTMQSDAFETLLALGQKAAASNPSGMKGPNLSVSGLMLPEMEQKEPLVPESLFTEWANLLPTDGRFYEGNGQYQCGSRLMTLMDDYQAWKSGRSSLTLPADSCPEGEKLSWLRENFSGELSAYELLDAIESMHTMGLMDRYEWNSVYGRSLTVVQVEVSFRTDENGARHPVIGGAGPVTLDQSREFRTVQPSQSPWNDGFTEAPLHGLHTLDDLLDWLADFRTKPVADWEVQRRAVLARNGVQEQFYVEA